MAKIFRLDRPNWIKTAFSLVILGALGGAACGFMLGRVSIRRSVYSGLNKDVGVFISSIESTNKRAIHDLAILNQSHLPPCSRAEKTWLRAFLYGGGFLRDAGRMQNGNILCSATFDSSALPKTQLQANARQPHGLTLYRAASPFSNIKGQVLIHQQGDFYVVPDPSWSGSIRQLMDHTEGAIPDPIHGKRVRADGQPDRIPGAVNDRDWQGALGDTLYVTRCSTYLDTCFVSWGSYRAALVASHQLLWLDSSVGGLAALTFCLLLALYQARKGSMSYLVRRAIRTNHILMVYQPIVDLQSLKVVGAEALVRLSDAAPIAHRPDIFVGIAEQQGLVCALTRRVFECCLKDFGAELRAHPDFRLSVNITAADLAEPCFLATIERRLAEEKISPRSLALEITEISTASTAVAIDAIHKLADRGHSVQIDDFGTGYSSLSYLRDLRVDAIKIDKSFTRTIGTGAVTEKLVPQIMAMADALEMNLTVEGIETPEQLRYFLAMDRPLHGQGWLFGRPISPAEFKRLYLVHPDRVVFRPGDLDGNSGNAAPAGPEKSEVQSSRSGLEFSSVVEKTCLIRAFS